SARAIHNLGVLHKDLEPRNILWSEETGRVMVIDFERAEVVRQLKHHMLDEYAKRRRNG
ncbi:hypothetical protein BU26DRAFT_379243, partial [Trematosphaeria pertusa]